VKRPQQSFLLAPGLASRLARIVYLAESLTGPNPAASDAAILRSLVISVQIEEWAATVAPRPRRRSLKR
jgi:hypothetical protein